MIAEETFGHLVRQYRRAAELTQEALAERAGLSVRSIQAMEAGTKHRPRQDTVQLLLAALAVPEDEQATFWSAAGLTHGDLQDMPALRSAPARPAGSSALRMIQGGKSEALPAAPPLPLVVHPTNLPDAPAVFIGRERELAEVSGLLEDPHIRLVTLTGPGGSGKTRLALETARALLHTFRDGVFFCDLAPLVDARRVPFAIARSLGVEEEPGGSLLDALSAYLLDKHLLLVLDNCEQVRAAAPQIGVLLDRCHRLSVLATSRICLHLAREHEYAVDPLPLPDLDNLPPLDQLGRYDAIALFVDRAGAARYGFTLTDENAPAVAEICHRLDGLPLSIELAAARIKVLPPSALLHRLDQRLSLLTGGAQDRPSRQQTVRATVDWSYRLLTEEERALLARLSVFGGGFSLEAAEAVCDPARRLDLLGLIESLVSWGLLRAAGEEEPRFGMLDTIREYASEQLAALGEVAELRARHALYFTHLAERAASALSGPEQTAWLERLDWRQENLRDALRWSLETESELGLRLAAALWRFWSYRGYFTEGQAWLEAVLAAGRETEQDAALRAEALHGAGGMALLQGEYERARELHQEALQLRQRLGDMAGIGASLNNLGHVARWRGQYEHARKLHEEAQRLVRERGDRRRMSAALTCLGMVETAQGRYERARELHEESLGLLRELSDDWAIAASLGYLADVATAQGEFDRAAQLLAQTLELARGQANNAGIAAALARLGTLAARQGDDERARELYDESLRLRRKLGIMPGVAAVLSSLGDIARRQGDPERARRLHAQSLRLFSDLGIKHGTASALAGLAAVAGLDREYARAARLLGAAEGIWCAIEGTPDPFQRRDMEVLAWDARRALTADRYQAEWEAGRAMSLEETVARALGEIE